MEKAGSCDTVGGAGRNIAPALHRCPDPAQVKEIQITAKNIQEVSNQLAECASELMKMEEENKSPEARQTAEEKKELLCRDWATQVGIKKGAFVPLRLLVHQR